MGCARIDPTTQQSSQHETPTPLEMEAPYQFSGSQVFWWAPQTWDTGTMGHQQVGKKKQSKEKGEGKEKEAQRVELGPGVGHGHITRSSRSENTRTHTYTYISIAGWEVAHKLARRAQAPSTGWKEAKERKRRRQREGGIVGPAGTWCAVGRGHATRSSRS